MNKYAKKYIPYGRQSIDEDDIQAVVDVLSSDWLTTGPMVDRFESKICEYSGAGEAVAVSSGTSALHAAMYALGIRPGDEVILPPMTFAATSNAVLYQGGTPVFADVSLNTLLIDPVEVEKKVTSRTKAVIAVDYAGQPCAYDELRAICDKHNIYLVSDACHSPGSEYKGRKTGTIADITAFSFHPVKHITTGEGGMITTDNKNFAERMRMFRNHGISADHRQRSEKGTWYYEMQDLGYNYRMTDIQCALGISQLQKLPAWIEKRNSIAQSYNEKLYEINGIAPLKAEDDRKHAYHLFVVMFEDIETRDHVYCTMRENSIGVNVHYIPIHLHPYYRDRFKTGEGMFTRAEEAYKRILSLPIYPGLDDEDIQRTVHCMFDAIK